MTECSVTKATILLLVPVALNARSKNLRLIIAVIPSYNRKKCAIM